MGSTFILNELQLFILQDKHYELSVALKCKNAWVLSHIDHDMFCFFLMVRMTGAGWCCRSGTLSTLFGNAP